LQNINQINFADKDFLYILGFETRVHHGLKSAATSSSPQFTEHRCMSAVYSFEFSQVG